MPGALLSPDMAADIAWPAIASLAMIVLYLAVTLNAGRMRGKTGVKAPDMTGHPDFERAFRVQMNTLEWLVMALPCLWLYALLGSPAGAALAGGLWCLGRAEYARAYLRDPSSRRHGMVITMVAQIWLLGGAIYGTATLLF